MTQTLCFPTAKHRSTQVPLFTLPTLLALSRSITLSSPPSLYNQMFSVEKAFLPKVINQKEKIVQDHPFSTSPPPPTKLPV